MKALKLLFFSLFSLFIGACTPQFDVKIDAISAEAEPVGQRYVLLPANDGVNDQDLQFLEYAAYVDRALNARGYQKAANAEAADIAVHVGYGVGDPQTHFYTYSVPIRGRLLNGFGYGGLGYCAPRFGTIAYTQQTTSYTTYERYLFLDAQDLHAYRRNGTEKQLWKTSVRSTGFNDDLRQAFPALLAASQAHIGSNSKEPIELTIKNDDPAVLKIKGLPLAKSAALESTPR